MSGVSGVRVRTGEERDALEHLLAVLALDQRPRIVELGLGSDVPRGCLGVVLIVQHLQLGGGEARLCVNDVRQRHGTKARTWRPSGR